MDDALGRVPGQKYAPYLDPPPPLRDNARSVTIRVQIVRLEANH